MPRLSDLPPALGVYRSLHFREGRHESWVSVKHYEVRVRGTSEVEQTLRMCHCQRTALVEQRLIAPARSVMASDNKPEAVCADAMSAATDRGTSSLRCPARGNNTVMGEWERVGLRGHNTVIAPSGSMFA
jgi:hypothetical protein